MPPKRLNPTPNPPGSPDSSSSSLAPATQCAACTSVFQGHFLSCTMCRSATHELCGFTVKGSSFFGAHVLCAARTCIPPLRNALVACVRCTTIMDGAIQCKMCSPERPSPRPIPIKPRFTRRFCSWWQQERPWLPFSRELNGLSSMPGLPSTQLLPWMDRRD
uniref:Uncharacterized protein n=1 Tax=Eutreptiella gymnastica TaxID=73025 RepID=A0A7S1N0K8_9EUGL|mmetsp:Transcript_100939/g.174359  ORF Transcript_100939/g.174359 Transcript_100939/m.174359 type:complete len:162 (+) Transcript_100939:252-737(+)